MSDRLTTRAPAMVAAVVAVITGWLLLAPAQLGGPIHYAVVDGSSMEPELSEGDLVLVRSGGAPRVGSVVLYRDPELGVRLLHRVVGEEGGRLVLKGDANDFLDDARPRPEEVAGSLWLSLPRLGSALLWLREPSRAALVAFVLALVALGGGGAARSAPRGELRGG